ncbi:FUSC family protein [Stutzerimonas stutzeri]|uniref:FUSC family protein n=1 Tax=Stutzerimonas stutzeri TaxID=316 RepID=A0A2N8SPU7_STUST|nr:FUSC family protein [Stutzerimonas stutzeri]MCQ4327508.1 FUSC family protein [Stutzerimonas stutzeri]PNG04499.1 FUSC family protein [Stutzerimonas stutzeri]
MNMPTWREWLFSAKALIAALLALYIALAIPLDNPYWAMASVYIVSHPLSGATRSKAIYRALGTLSGAAASVVLLPLFAHQPVMLSIAMALWVGGLLFLSLLDRSPRSYIFMLAAYTVPLISLSEVNHPQTIFDVALARSEEILLGIVCASLVNAVLFPSRIAPVLGVRMDMLLRDGRAAIGRLLATRHLGDAEHGELHRLLLDVMGLDGMIVHLGYDSRSALPARHAREFRARMAMLTPQLMSVGDSLRRLQRESGGMLPELEEHLQLVDGWIQGDAAQFSARHLQLRSRQLETWLGDTHPEHALTIAGGLAHLRALIDLWQDCLNLRQAFATGHPERTPALHYRVRQLIGGPRHYDYGLLAISAGSVAVSILCISLLWFVSGWEHGYSAVFIAAVAGCFFAGQDNPAPFIKSFLVATVISSVAGGIYLFALMPNVHDFGSLAALLAGPLLLLGTLAGRPQYAGTVIVLAVQTISNITIQDSYRADFPLFADIALSTTLGVIFALVWARLTRPFGMHWAARRLARAGWLSLARLVVAKNAGDHAEAASDVIDRTAQLLPRLGQLGDRGLALRDATRELRLCFRLLELKRLRLPPAVRVPLQPALLAAREYFQVCARSHHPPAAPDSLRRQLDDCLAYLQGRPERVAGKARLAVHGLRLALFPDNPSTVRPLPPGAGLEPAGAGI